MSINSRALLDAVQSNIMELGLFDRVNTHEPKNAPGHGLTCAIWVESINAEARYSGLAATSARVTFSIRIYLNMLKEPQDSIDPEVMEGTDAILNALNGDFSLGGDANYVDLAGMSSRAGFATIDKAMYRVMTITAPVVVADVWEQVS